MEWLERHRGTIAAFLVVLVALGAFALLQVPRRPALQIVTSSPPLLAPIKVHVAGAVMLPGVYQLPADARVEDAVRAAGGPSPSANVALLNLAQPLKDGQQLLIPDAGSTVPPSAPSPQAAAPRPAASSPTPSAAPGGKLNLNTASQRELEALPGIGEVLAKRILDWRQANGPFTSVDQLRDSKILSVSTFDKMKDLIEAR